MSEIDYQALRDAAQNAKDLGGIKNYKRGEKAVAEFELLITPHIVLALLDELEAAEKRIAELESLMAPQLPQRAVPDKATWRDAPVNSENVDWAAGWNACRARIIGNMLLADMDSAEASKMQELTTDNTAQQFESLSRGDK